MVEHCGLMQFPPRFYPRLSTWEQLKADKSCIKLNDRSFLCFANLFAGRVPVQIAVWFVWIWQKAVAVPHKMNSVYVNVNAVIIKEPQQ